MNKAKADDVDMEIQRVNATTKGPLTPARLTEIESASSRLHVVLPHFRAAADRARDEGVVGLGVIAMKPDGGGRVTAQFEAEEFFADLATMSEAGWLVPTLYAELATRTTERDDARAWVRRLTASERVLTCVYCGEAYPPGSPDHGAEVLTAHVKVCAKHPLREAEAEIVRLKSRLGAVFLAPRFLTPTYLDSPRRHLVDRLIDPCLRCGPADIVRIYRWITSDVDDIQQDEIEACATRLGATQRGLRWGYWAEG